MDKKFDYKKEWENTRKKLLKFGREATVLVKKGEKELVDFSQKSKMQIDVAALSLRMEKLYYLIGKEYVRLRDKSKPTDRLRKSLLNLEEIKKQQISLKGKLKKTAKKKYAKKKVV